MTEQIEKGHSDDLTHWGKVPAPEADTAKPAIHDMDMIMDLPVKVMIELGRTKMPLGDLMSVQNGASLVRVHDVQETVQALRFWQAAKP